MQQESVSCASKRSVFRANNPSVFFFSFGWSNKYLFWVQILYLRQLFIVTPSMFVSCACLPLSALLPRRPMFPGGTCFPLSGPDSDDLAAGASGACGVSRDQLSTIFDVMGTPSEEDIAEGIEDEETRGKRLSASVIASSDDTY